MAEIKEVAELQLDVDRLSIRVDGYHKRLGDMECGCEKRSGRFGERIGVLETSSALQNQRLETMEENVKELVRSNQKLQVKVGVIVSVGVALQVIAGFALQFFVATKQFSENHVVNYKRQSHSAKVISNEPD